MKIEPCKVFEMVVYKTYRNGRLSITNVPHNICVSSKVGTANERIQEEYLLPEVLENIVTIYKYMEQHGLMEMDYQKFLSIWNFDKNVSTSSTMVKEEIKEVSLEDQKEVIAYVREEWIDKYQKMKLQEGNLIYKEKLDFFHECLERLPELQQKIIEMKYLQVEENGRFPLDDFIYPELHIGRSYYYIQKKKALYSLGLSLLRN